MTYDEVVFPDQLIKIKRAKIQIQETFPFYSELLFFVKIKEMVDHPQINSMAVDDDSNLYYDPKFVEKLTTSEVKAVLLHETIHMALMHPQRGLDKNHGVWGYAVDAVANYNVFACRLTLPEGSAVEIVDGQDGLFKINGQQFKINDVASKSAEAIYNELMNMLPPDMIKDLSQIVYIIDGQGGRPSKDKHGLDGHIISKSKEKAERSEKAWKGRIIKAGERARAAGKLPGNMGLFIDELVEPEIDWKTYIYRFIDETLGGDYTYDRRYKTSAALGYYIPDVDIVESVDIIYFCDSSGSVSPKEKAEYVGEAVSLKKAFDEVNMKFGWIDTKVYDMIDINGEDEILKVKPRGGGGTDMRKAIDWVKKNKPDAKVVVILTDGFTPFPKEKDMCNAHVLWVISAGGLDKAQFPKENIGTFIKMKTE